MTWKHKILQKRIQPDPGVHSLPGGPVSSLALIVKARLNVERLIMSIQHILEI